MDEGELPEIGTEEQLSKEFVKVPAENLTSSPRRETEAENKENESTLVVKQSQSSGSWLVFSGSKNLFANDDNSDASSSSLSLPAVDGLENEDDVVLQLDGSSFLDEQEILRSHEPAGSDEASENKSDAVVKRSKKSHKKKTKKKHKVEEDADDDVPPLSPALEGAEMEGVEMPAEQGSDDEAPLESKKKSKRLSKKELDKMHSDAQRVLREAPVSIPIRRAEPLNLDDILNEVAAVNPEVRKFLDKEKKHEKPAENKKPEEPTPVVDLTGTTEPEPKTQKETKKDDDSDIELEIVDEEEEQKKPPANKPATHSASPGVAWLMERFKRHSAAGKHATEGVVGPAAAAPNWDVVKEHLVEEMTAQREKGLQERIERYKLENDEELGGEAEEEEEAESEKGDDGDDDDDSYTTISDDEEDVRAEKKKSKKKKGKGDGIEQSTNIFLDKEALETGSEDDDYQPSEGHRDDDSICTEDENVKSGSDDDDEDDDEGDDDEIEDDEAETSDEEEEILRSSCKKKKNSSKKSSSSPPKQQKKANRVDSDDDDDKDDGDDERSEKDDDELPELAVEERQIDSDDDDNDDDKERESRPVASVDLMTESASSIVMPPDMPRPNQLFNIYNDPFEPEKSNEVIEKEADTAMDELLGLCTGPFLAVEKDTKSVVTADDDESSNSGAYKSSNLSEGSKSADSPVDETQTSEVVVPAKKQKHVYGKSSKPSTKPAKPIPDDNDGESEREEISPDVVADSYGDAPVEKKFESKRAKKERMKRMREFIEDEAELSDSDVEAGRVSDDEVEGSSDDSYETDPEFEDEALDKLSARQLKNQVESIHMRQVIDEDERDLLHLREAIIPDADLADAVGPRLRRFRWAEAWRDMAGGNSQTEGGPHADDDWLGLGNLDATSGTPAASLSSMWQKQRVERERWLQTQPTEPVVSDSQATVILTAETESEKSGTESQLVRFGMSAMRKSSGGSVTTSTEVSIATNTRRVSHGSMLSWLQQKELDKIAQNVAPSNGGSSSNGAVKRRSLFAPGAGGADPKPDDLMTAPAFKSSRASAGPFIVTVPDDRVSPGDTFAKKRKFESSIGSSSSNGNSSSASKRGKKQQGSVFDFLS